MKSVLMSIHPKWCELIAIGEKTIEVRKTAPKLYKPFKVYIYETKDKHYDGIGVHWDNGRNFIHNGGKIIGEFMCDEVYEFFTWGAGVACADKNINLLYPERVSKETRLTERQIVDYLETGKGTFEGYGWHISDLKIYDKPKELNEFGSLVKTIDWERGTVNLFKGNKFYKPMKRPPVSWCYVEEINDNTLQ